MTIHINKYVVLIFVLAALLLGGYHFFTNVPRGQAIAAAVLGADSAATGTTTVGTATGTGAVTGAARAGAATFATTGQAAGQAAGADLTTSTVTIQSADSVVAEVSASGNIALASQRTVASSVGGTVETIAVAVGDTVAAGDPLLTLDTTELERAVLRAELSVETSRNALIQASEEATPSEIAQAEAQLASAQETLADVQAGPSQQEIAAAQAAAAAAWASYNELQAGPSQAELVQLSADLRKAEVAVQEAQRAYDQIAWQGNAGASTQAADLQDATIDYESAQAAYEETTAAAATSDVQSAISSAQDAQNALEELLSSPTPAEIAEAEAAVAEAEAALEELLAGPSETDLRDAEISLEQALVDLEEAQSELAQSELLAPIGGTVIAIDAEVGTELSAGSAAVTLADPQDLELTINVVELDITGVYVGQEAQVEIDALAGQTFAGAVSAISPSNDADASVVQYPVTISLTDDALEGVRPGMTAVAALVNDTVAGGWLVPSNAIRSSDGGSTVMVVRDGAPTPVTVTTGAIQGEWTVVQSDQLQAGDQVVGSVTSFVNQESNFGGGFGGGGQGVRVPGGGVPGGGIPGGGRPGQ